MKRNTKTCTKCNRNISLSNYKKHLNSCDGTFFLGPNKPAKTNNKQKRYDWKKIQKSYDSGMSWKDLTEIYNISMASIAKASKRGDFNSRSRSVSMQMRVKEYGPNIMGEEAKKRLSKKMSEKNPGGRCKWYTVSGTKVQGRWERDFAKKCNELKIKWQRCAPILYNMDGKVKRYTPDFYLPEYDILIEIKGYWWGSDKTKMRNVIEQNPEKKIIILEKDDFYKFMEGELVWS